MCGQMMHRWPLNSLCETHDQTTNQFCQRKNDVNKMLTYRGKSLYHAQHNQCPYIPIGGHRNKETHCADRKISGTKHKFCAIAFREEATRDLCHPMDPKVCAQHTIRLYFVPVDARRRGIELQIEENGCEKIDSSFVAQVLSVNLHQRNRECAVPLCMKMGVRKCPQRSNW